MTKTNQTGQDSPMRRLRKGEYNLVKISQLGFDPVTGRSFEECNKEWRTAFNAIQSELGLLKQWNIIRYIKIWYRLFVLAERQGF